MRLVSPRALAAAWAAAACTSAQAHGGLAGFGSLASGFVHPLLEPAHLLAVLCLGALAGQRGLLTQGPVFGALAAASGLGLLAAYLGATPPRDDLLLALTALGAAAALSAWREPRGVLPVLAAALGLGIGLGSAADALPLASRWAHALGLLAGLLFWTADVAALVQALQSGRHARWGRVATRVLGSWLCASSLLVLALRLRPGP